MEDFNLCSHGIGLRQAAGEDVKKVVALIHKRLYERASKLDAVEVSQWVIIDVAKRYQIAATAGQPAAVQVGRIT